MRGKCIYNVPDYEHDGDLQHEIDLITKIDPSAKVLNWAVDKEDPEADCETCSAEIEFDWDKLEELQKQFNFEYVRKIKEVEKIIVFRTATGKTFSYNNKGKYTHPIPLDLAQELGLTVAKHKWAQPNGNI